MEEQPIVTGESNASDIDLVNKVKRQVEYYFSKDNLQNDHFLTSQMDASMCVPISVVMKFAKLKALTQDEAVLRRALESSTLTVIDGKIKANAKVGTRSTIILRDIPSDAPEEEVREIFAYEGCKPISSIRSDIGDTWFVVMESEEDARDTAMDLKLKKRVFRGEAVKARVKSETLVRSFYPIQHQPPVVSGPPMFSNMPFPPQYMPMPGFGYGVPGMGMPGMGMGMPYGMPMMPPPPAQLPVVNEKQFVGGGGNEGGDAASKEAATGPAPAAEQQQVPEKKGTPSAVRKEPKATQQPSSSKVASGGGALAAPTGAEKKGNTNPGQPRSSKGGKGGGGSSVDRAPVDPGPVPTPGYKGPFVKYSFDEIITIVKEVREAELPNSIVPSSHPAAMTKDPNLDLLRRQRTFSIDETREQLRQGRPVQREAIMAGAVDYKSLMCGDYDQSPGSGKAGSSVGSASPSASPNPGSRSQSDSASGVSSGEPSPRSPAEALPAATPDDKVAAASPSPSTAQVPQKKTSTGGSWAALVKSNADVVAPPAAPVSRLVPAKVDKAPPAQPQGQGSDGKKGRHGGGNRKEGDRPHGPAADGDKKRGTGERRGRDKDAAGPGPSGVVVGHGRGRVGDAAEADKGEWVRGGKKKVAAAETKDGAAPVAQVQGAESSVAVAVVPSGVVVAAETSPSPVLGVAVAPVASASAADPSPPSREATPSSDKEKLSLAVPVPATVAAVASPVPSAGAGWGGKLSFANIVKQSADPPAAAASPTESTPSTASPTAAPSGGGAAPGPRPAQSAGAVRPAANANPNSPKAVSSPKSGAKSAASPKRA